ncbi:M20 family metallopeptidase [Paenibacillus flagellatus]|uniref:Acetylornithine deacetylase n=1 Tax=Paenibacillus flagellatus TaxID=2211139 RepID=A0A2V5JVX0_9BACL|nr:M20 family metallopeptidase [Paenibacillus flagellatus]PYI50879.1 acetylornithine deacetylase [Paenibacillus flagellatus]
MATEALGHGGDENESGIRQANGNGDASVPGNGKHPALPVLEDMIRIQSVNPYFDESGEGERAMADYVERRCRAAGLAVTRQNVFPGRDNLIVELRVGKPDKTLLLEAHMDTVTLGGMPDALMPTYRDGRLYGRGACDTKGSLAGMLYAMERAARNPEAVGGDLVLCASVDEEHAYKGLLAFLELGLPVAGAVVGEPTELGIAVANKGCVRVAATTHGKAAHSSMPAEGDSAIMQMMRVLRFIRERLEPELASRAHPLCGSPTIVVGTIRGGTQINIVPDRCVIEIDRRIIPGERPEIVERELAERLRRELAPEGVKLTVERLLLDWALDTPHDAAIVRAAQAAAAAIGLDDNLRGVTYGCDASKLQELKGIPSIVYGPGSIAQAHTNDEWVPVSDVERAAEFYWRLAQTFGRL